MSSAERPHLLSVLIPVYNEANTLRTLLARVLAANCPIPLEIVAVDDGSSDGSLDVLRDLERTHANIRVLQQSTNLGKGAAIRMAIEHMRGTIAIIQDADLEYDPREFGSMIQPILDGRADAVFGSRFASASQRKVMLFWHTLANRALTLAANVLNDINLTDMETCYKAVRADILRQIPLKSNRFGIEPELTTRLAQWGARIYEVPISYHGRTFAEGKKIGLRDAFDCLWSLIRFRFLDTRFTTHEGFFILQSVRRARGFNRWMLSRFRHHVGRRVLEAGCGIGSFTEQLLDRERLVCVDSDPLYVELISRRFGHLTNVSVHHGDLQLASTLQEVRAADVDTIICLNVLEHIERDDEVLRLFHDVLTPGGHAAILVPAQPWLYSAADRALGHVRRYTRASLTERMRTAGFEVIEIGEFNRLGVVGWLLNKLLGRSALSPTQIRLYNLLLPAAKLVDILRLGPGLSVIAVGRKSTAVHAELSAPKESLPSGSLRFE